MRISTNLPGPVYARCLRRWRRRTRPYDAVVDVVIAHVHLTSSYRYLPAPPELMALAGAGLEQDAGVSPPR